MTSSFTKRPGFAREQTGDINDTVFDDSEGTTISRVTEADLPYEDLSKKQKADFARITEQEDILRDIRTELRRVSFLLELIAGSAIPAEVFEDESDH